MAAEPIRRDIDDDKRLSFITEARFLSEKLGFGVATSRLRTAALELEYDIHMYTVRS